MKKYTLLAAVFFTLANIAHAQNTGTAKVEVTRPKTFPHRVWAACDFEAVQFAWFGPAVTSDIPQYPGNKTVMGVAERPYKNFSGIMTGINPTGMRVGKENFLYLRYKLTGATEATFQHFGLDTEDNNHIRLSGLTEGKWSEVTMNFTRDARRNDGTAGVPFRAGERMDDLKIFVGKPNDGKKYDLLVDDVIFFSNDPELPPEPEPFPRRVLFVAAFDTGHAPEWRDKMWPGEYDLVAPSKAPPDSLWGVAKAVPHKETKGKWIRMQIKPPRAVAEHTKLRFRYYLTGASKMTVQMFDVTDNDNRHIHLDGCKQKQWVTQYLDFTNNARRNDGKDTPFAADHVVDDIFFFVKPDGDEEVNLFVDEVVLYDAGKAR
jgi:hypothetical protein